MVCKYNILFSSCCSLPLQLLHCTLRYCLELQNTLDTIDQLFTTDQLITTDLEYYIFAIKTNIK